MGDNASLLLPALMERTFIMENVHPFHSNVQLGWFGKMDSALSMEITVLKILITQMDNAFQFSLAQMVRFGTRQ
jgi:hypothetical protein